MKKYLNIKYSIWDLSNIQSSVIRANINYTFRYDPRVECSIVWYHESPDRIIKTEYKIESADTRVAQANQRIFPRRYDFQGIASRFSATCG